MQTQLEKIRRLAKNKNPSADVTYTKKKGYVLVLPGKEIALGKDSVHAQFFMEKLLEETL